MVDMAHYAGLIAAGVYEPVPFADFVTSTTHKTLRGPRGGIILAKAEFEKSINSNVFPTLQGGPLEHVIAAKAVAFKEALLPEFKVYQEQVLKNAAIMAKTLGERGVRIVSGRTEPCVPGGPARQGPDWQGRRRTAGPRPHHREQERDSERPGNPVRDLRHPHRFPGHHHPRLQGSRSHQVANLVADVLDNPNDDALIARVAEQATALCHRFRCTPNKPSWFWPLKDARGSSFSWAGDSGINLTAHC